eukprot:1157922-Pelagomonas_calceolata.AAC.9
MEQIGTFVVRRGALERKEKKNYVDSEALPTSIKEGALEEVLGVGGDAKGSSPRITNVFQKKVFLPPVSIVNFC